MFLTSFHFIEERLFLMHKWGKTSFREMVDKIKVLKANKNYFKPTKNYSLQQELHDLYGEFSAFSHISIKSVREIDIDYRGDYSFYQNHQYNNKDFTYGIEKIWRVIDIVLSMLVLSSTQFYGYSATKDFLNALIMYKDDSATKFLIRFIKKNKLEKKLTVFNLMI